MDKWLRDNQEEGIVLGKCKIYILAYADDMVILAATARELQNMINRLDKFLTRKRLQLNVDKSKVMVFRKGGRGAKEEVWYWKGQQLEKVKTFKYLGYMFQCINGRLEHLRMLKKKAEVAIRRIWGVGERRFSGEIGWRVRLYEAMVNSILMHGVEVWGWEIWGGLDAMRRRYMKWVLGVKWNVPNYIREECGSGIGWEQTIIRAYKYELKLSVLGKGGWVSECLQEKKGRET